MKKDFFVFSSLDGVLNSKLWLAKYKEFGLDQKGYTKLICPDCLSALNYLIKRLSKKYNVKFVLSSLWRMNVEATKKKLILNGLDYKLELLQTIDFGVDSVRGLEIQDFIEKNGVKNNYLIIDDDADNVRPFHQEDKIIKTDNMGDGLTDRLIAQYISEHKKMFETECVREIR